MKNLVWIFALTTTFAASGNAQQSVIATDASASLRSHLPLHTDGPWIVDSSGVRFKLRSVNWYGAEEQDHVVAGLEYEKIQTIVEWIRYMGFNSVRLPWSNEMYETNPVVPDYTVTANPQFKGKRALQVFDAVVSELARQGLAVILDNHMSNGDWCCSDTDGNGLWYNGTYPERNWIADWKGMVRRYRNIPEVIGVDLRNQLRAGATWGGDPSTDWHAAAERGGNAVLKINPDLLVFVEGINYASDLTGVAQLPVHLSVPNRLVYSAHDYGFGHGGLSSESQLFQILDHQWGYIATPDQPYTAPIWIGEFGTCHDDPACLVSTTPGPLGFWLQAFRDYLDQRDFDWSYWAINGTQARGTTRTLGDEETYGILHHYWNAPALTSLMSPPQNVDLIGILQTVMQPAQGPGVAEAIFQPVVTMTSPLADSLYAAGSNITLTADAALRQGTINEVQFYANGDLVGTASSAPFQVLWSDVPAGSYSVTAVATAQNGESGTSKSITLLVFDYSSLNEGANSIAINFGDYQTTPMDPSETAGVFPQQYWNQASGGSGFLPSLVDNAGASTSAQAMWSSNNLYFTSTPDQPGNLRMMRGYLDNSNTSPTTIQVVHVPQGFDHFDIYLYFDGANGSAQRIGHYRVVPSHDGTGSFVKPPAGCAGEPVVVLSGADAPNTDFSGTFTLSSGGSPGNYVLFPDCTGESFTIVAVHGASSDNQYRAPLNGLQIVSRN